MGRARKGQYFSFDAIIASIIFIIAISVLSSYWFGVRSVMDSRSENMYNEVIRISDMLMSEGTPANWNDVTIPYQGIQQFGLLANKSTYEVLEAKANRLNTFLNDPQTDPQYNATRKRMGLDKYQIYLAIGNNTNTIYYTGYDPGTPGAKPANIATATRTAHMKVSGKDTLVTVKVVLWTENFDN